MRFLLTAVLAGGVIGQALADDYDDRFYVSPSVGFIDTDPVRSVDDGAILSLSAGLPVSAKRAYEITVDYSLLDDVDLIGLSASMLTYFDPASSPLYSIVSLGALSVDSDIGADYESPTLAGGLGYFLKFGNAGGLRFEGVLRADLHFDDDAGIGGKSIFIEPIYRVGYAYPFGARSVASKPAEGDVQVIEPAGSDQDADGVMDSADLCPGTPLGTVVDQTGCASEAPTSFETSAAPSSSDCREPAIGESVDEYGCAVERAVILNGVNFEFDSTTLTKEAQFVLDDVAQVLAGMPGTPVELAGHTSDEGDEFYNIDLSQRRASAVREYLIDQGVPASQMRAVGYGGKAPLTTNDTIDGRQENRRVEIRVVE